ncbi:hypothetical protein ACFC09_29295 [Streptomyces sp. NPDC056161]|uniref:hypothetical protein n=1 Tax=Streptomyces sp. NPDC056161 TaxID=3345732 RepID=UPI0035D8F933
MIDKEWVDDHEEGDNIDAQKVARFGWAAIAGAVSLLGCLFISVIAVGMAVAVSGIYIVVRGNR